MYNVLHFIIIILFNVDNFLLCVIYRLNFTVFTSVTRISRCIQRTVLSAVSHNRGRSWNVNPWIRGTIVYIRITGLTLIPFRQIKTGLNKLSFEFVQLHFLQASVKRFRNKILLTAEFALIILY
jgi:hypothetical protein